MEIISVKYESDYMPKIFEGRPYSYYTAIKVKIGDLVMAPTVKGTKVARVSEIDVPEYKVESFKDSLKVITKRIDKEQYLKTNQILEKVA